jgi:hypothetical protein
MALLPLHRAAAALLRAAGSKDRTTEAVPAFATAAAETRKLSGRPMETGEATALFAAEIGALGRALRTIEASPETQAAAISPDHREPILFARVAWRSLHACAASADEAPEFVRRQLRLEQTFAEALRHAGVHEDDIVHAPAFFDLVIERGADADARAFAGAFLRLLRGAGTQLLLGVNEFQGVRYYRKEGFEKVLKWFYTVSVLPLFADAASAAAGLRRDCGRVAGYARDLAVRAEGADYQYDQLLQLLGETSRL